MLFIDSGLCTCYSLCLECSPVLVWWTPIHLSYFCWNLVSSKKPPCLPSQSLVRSPCYQCSQDRFSASLTFLFCKPHHTYTFCSMPVSPMPQWKPQEKETMTILSISSSVLDKYMKLNTFCLKNGFFGKLLFLGFDLNFGKPICDAWFLEARACGSFLA